MNAFSYAKAYLSTKILQQPSELIFFVTNRCNLNCSFCCYRYKLNKPGMKDLGLPEIKKIATSYNRFVRILVSGGEPYLRKDLPEILRSFSEHNRLDTVYIPTNGLLTREVISTTEQILKETDFPLIVAVTVMDRREPESSKPKETLTALLALADEYPRLTVKATTIVSKENIHDVAAIRDSLTRAGINVHQHVFGIMRRNPGNNNLLLDAKELNDLREFLIENRERTNLEQRMVSSMWDLISDRLVELGTGARVPHCVAGRYNVVIEHDGIVRACEPSPYSLHLRDFGYDLSSLLKSEAYDKMRNALRNCDCMHPCYIAPNQFFNPSNVVKAGFRAILGAK